MINKRNAEYWQKRFEDILVDNEKLALSYEKELAGIYKQRKLEVEKELESFYQRYSTETGLSLADVKKRLNPAELKRFKTQQQSYLNYIQGLVKKGANLSDYEAKIKELSGKAYVTRLQELQYNLNTHIMTLTGEQQVRLKDVMKESYLQGYFKSVHEIQKGMGMGMSFTVPNTDDVEKVLKTNWNGNNYSKSVWSNKQKLTDWLNTDLPRHFASGASNQNMAKDLAKKLDTNYKNAVRLVRTEVNYISNQSTMDAYRESGVVDKYEILATLDSKTSEICQEMDGKIFNLNEAKVAVNMPPFHVYCRTTTIPYIEPDEFDDVETRIARAEDGSSYYVPANMTYKEWNEKFGQGAKVDKLGKTIVPKDEKPVQLQTKEEPVKGSEIPVEERDYVDLTQEDINDWSHDVVPNLTKEQLKAVEEYTGQSYYNINGHLRGKFAFPDPDIERDVAMIRSAMSEIPQDTRLFRTMNKYDFLKTFGDDLLVELQPTNDTQIWTNKLAGKMFKDKAFQSTSWTPQSSYIDGRIDDRAILFRIKTPKGTKALPVEKFSLVEGEKEIILNSGNSYIITAIKKTDTPNGVLIMVDCLLHEGV